MNDAERENEIFIKLKLYFGYAITHNGPPSVFLWIVTNLSATKNFRHKNCKYVVGDINKGNKFDY